MEADVVGEQKAGPIAALPDGHVANRVLRTVQLAVLIVSVAAAIPTARNLYHSWAEGVPFGEVPHRLAQYDLWMKNLDCKIEYRVLSTANGSKVHAGTCAKTGDIAIKIVEQGGRTAYEWIAFDNLQKPGAKTAGFTGHLISRANAGGFDSLSGVAASSPAKLAQAQMEVVCQVRRGSNIIRIIKEGDKCYREVVSPMKGGVEKTEEVSCETSC
jgi:hypothetical protein